MKGNLGAAALLLAIGVIGGACAAAGSESGSGSSAGGPKRADRIGGDHHGTRGTKASLPASDTKDGSDENVESERTRVADTAATADGESGGYSYFEETEPDREGDAGAPAYAELTAASIESSGDDAVFELTFGANLPRRVVKGQNLIAGIGLLADDSHPQFAVVLQGTHEGWTAALQTDKGMSPIRDAPKLEGREATIVVPWREVMGFREFRWGASLRWYDLTSTPQSGVADKLPNDGPAKFPSGGP